MLLRQTLRVMASCTNQGCLPVARVGRARCFVSLAPCHVLTRNAASCKHHPIARLHAFKCTRIEVIVKALSTSGDANQQLKEAAALDKFIDDLLAAKNQQQLTQLVAQNLLSCNQKFWLRIATRSDGAASKDEKDKLAALSRTVMLLVDALVKEAEGQISQSGDVLQEVLTAAAEENGEWQLPLAPAKVDAMRQVLQRRANSLDEAFLGSAFAWMRKAKDDNLDGMVVLIQKVLQLYAAQQLVRPGAGGPSDVVDEVLAAEESDWESLIRKAAQHGSVSEAAFMEELQKRMENIVLGVSSGTYSQRVLAEYLKELESRAQAAFSSAE